MTIVPTASTKPTAPTTTIIPALLAHAAKLPPGPYIEDRYQIVVDLDDDSVVVLDKPEYALLPILKTARSNNVVDARPFVDTVKVIFADLLEESSDNQRRCANFRRIVASSDEAAAKAMLVWFDKQRPKTLAKLQRLVVDADKSAKAASKKSGREAKTINMPMLNVVFTYDRAYVHDLCREAVEAEIYGAAKPDGYCLATGDKTTTARTIPGFSFGGASARFSSVNEAAFKSFGFEQGNVAPIGIKASLDLVKAFADLVSWGTRTVVLKQGDDETAATTTSFRAMKYGFLAPATKSSPAITQVTWVPGGTDPFADVWTSSAVTAKMADTLFSGKRVIADSTPLYLMQLKANQARVAVVAFEATTVAAAARHLARWQSYMPGVGLKRLQQIITAKEAKRDANPVPWLHCHLQQALLLGKPMSRDVLALALHAAQHGAYDRLARAFCGAWLRWNRVEVDRDCFKLGRFYGKAARLQQLDGQERGGVFNFLDNPGTFVEQVLRVSASRAKRVGDRGERMLADMLRTLPLTVSAGLPSDCKSSVEQWQERQRPHANPRTHEQRAAFWAGFSSEEWEKDVDIESAMT